MALPRPTIVIFDMDGTTVRHVNQRLLHILEWMDDTAHRIGRIKKWFARGAKGPLSILEPDYTPPSKANPKVAVHKFIHKVRRKSVEDIVQPMPGIYSVLNFLKKNNIPMAIVSNGLGQGYGYDVLKEFRLEQFFDAYVFREDIKKSKPDPEPIMLVLERLPHKITPDDVIWYIGDRHKDIKAAMAANKRVQAQIVPVACAFNAAVAILDHGQPPEQIILSYFDMYERLSNLFAQEIT